MGTLGRLAVDVSFFFLNEPKERALYKVYTYINGYSNLYDDKFSYEADWFRSFKNILNEDWVLVL